MGNIGLILLAFAFVLLIVSSRFNPPNWNLLALGLACWVLAELIGGASHFGFAH